MACKAHLDAKVVGDTITFTATCTDTCEDKQECMPIIEPDVSHDDRFNQRHSGRGSKEATLIVDVKKPVIDFTVTARCKCSKITEGGDTYTFSHNPGTSIGDDILSILHFVAKIVPLIK